MHFHFGFWDFLIFGLILILWKAIFLFVNIEARRNKWHIPSAVSGLIC